VLTYDDFTHKVGVLVTELLAMRDAQRIMLAPQFEESTESLVRFGLRNVGVYHSKRPLLRHKSGGIITKSLKTLYYYRNRLDGYNLDKLM
jgi:glycerol-3-phosphate O-acyltransferase